MSDINPGVPDIEVPESAWLFLPSACANHQARRRELIQCIADAQLERCLAWLQEQGFPAREICALKRAMRPQPPSLKQQALEALDSIALRPCPIGNPPFDPNEGIVRKQRLIRQALESLPD